MIYLNLFLITYIVVIITDISGFFDSLQDYIAKWINAKRVNIKLLTCSFCQNWWLGLVYLYFAGEITLFNIAYVLTLSVLTENIKYSIYLIKDTITKVINYLQ